MHIPDGMLDVKTFATLWTGGAGCVAYASWWIRKHLDGAKIVLMAVLAALIFGLQMLNFPIAAGTSGHFTGGAFVGILLGAWPACIVMSVVLVVQALFFGDGGITTFGANLINMGVIAPFVAAFIYQIAQRISKSYAAKIIGAFIGAFVAIVASSAAVALELWASNHAQFFVALGSMVFWHTLIGIGEGIITAGLVAYIVKVRPQLLSGERETHDTTQTGWGTKTKQGTKTEQGASSLKSVCVVLGILAVAAAGLSFLASEHPDGLEFVYFETGVGLEFEESVYVSMAPLSDYLLPGVDSKILAKIGAGIIGGVLTGITILGLVTLLKRQASKRIKQKEQAGEAKEAQRL